MINAALYNKSNVWSKRDVLQLLQEFGPNIKWKQSGEIIIDIGCGDGSVTVDILRKFIPPNYRKIVGCDVSEDMVKFSNENYSEDDIEFQVLDIGGQLPEPMRNSFDYAVSFHALHWVRDQEKAFTNIYELLTEGGGCWLMILDNMILYDIWRRLARMDRWRHWLKDIEHYVGAYHDVKEPEIVIKQIMKRVGFKNIEVVTRPMSFTYENVDIMKMAITSLIRFKIPKEILHTYLDDVENELRCINEMKLSNKELINKTFHYDLLIVSGNK